MSLTITELPHKEQALFRSALRLYEVRQYKKGFKTCEQILKKFPNHGETLAVKGMFLAYLDRNEEAYTTIKRGIEISPQSSISWHVYGIVCRRDEKFEEATKCYEEALKVDSENVSILRELAQLQTQIRQYDRLVETRARIVKLDGNNTPSYWLGLAVAHQLTGRYDLALRIISTHENTVLDENSGFKANNPDYRAEVSELLMYKTWLMELNGDFQMALDNLKEIRPRITDVTGWKEQKAKLLLKLNRKEAAASAYQDLIERNPDNNNYICSYLLCNGLDMSRPEDKDAVLEIIKGLQKQFPISNTLKFVPLTFCTGDDFVREADILAKYSLRKGIPSLFASMKTLYMNEAKGTALGKLFEGYALQLRDTKRFSDSTDDESSLVLMWCKLYLAQHADYYGDYERALKLVEEAISTSPDTVDLYMVKAKVLKHAGDIRGARDIMDFGRQKDLKDRFINTKTVKYMLRNNEVDEAEKTIVLLVRDDAPHKVQEIVDTQTIWYMREQGHAYRRLGDIGRALKHYQQVADSFATYHNDQYDFHSYSMRKFTVRAYNDILKWEDQLFTHHVYVDSAKAAIDCYVDLYDRKAAGSPFVPISEKPMKPFTRNGSAKQGQHNLSAGLGETKPVAVDVDPNGSKFVEADDYLERALKFVEVLETYVGSQPETHVSAFEVHLRMKKYFLALKSINSLKAIDDDYSSLVPMVVRMRAALDSDETFAAPMKAALKDQLFKAFGDASIESTIETHKQSLTFMLAGAKCMIRLGGESNVARAKDLLLQAASDRYGETRTLKNLLAAKDLLVEAGASESELATYATSAKQVFALSTCF
ncbi:hypothetical protein GGI25_000366 [Coemansia spiralis]|uniref:Uncharacterized protein n=2 Tax=Coemansia TaxID=4863 RepID=A0A9W8GC78_9FUNG|nr:NMDA receptor-regulated protein 1-domain-containing protein [Coemansia spiralis]KAJ1996303.1 hypothetical protein EDC05_000193 [Coemansia umbellata]KAJ2625940.1 hypothetical protein GGI26_000024 [Coemansia sp. RSA 1358]KAJ2680731.1 hypothetical protein GGI25_000366 [Coemansia spiralis]